MSETADAPNRVQAFLETLDKLPPFHGVTFRGCTADASFVRDGQAVVTRGVLSTSRNLDVATEGRTTPAVYAIMSRTGRDISPFSAAREEREIVFRPGSLLFLAETHRIEDLDVRLVFELEVGEGPPRLPDDLVPQFAEEMGRFLRERGPVPRSDVTAIPGKFAGDIS